MPLPIKIRDQYFDWEDTPYFMGILNVTPDSFSDGGEAETIDKALAKADKLLQAGAKILDIGGESTRPFAEPVPEEIELKRVLPVVKALREAFPKAILSIDTYKSKVAEETLKAGADIINDISGGQFDPKILDVAKDFNCPIVIMHIQGTPQTMQINPQYQDVIKEIKTYFSERLIILSQKGISLDKVILDPGLGFGKNFTHNLSILKGLKEFQEFDRPILLGPSRKSFIGEILKKPVSERDAGTAGVAIFAYLQGVHFLRVHNVAMVQDTLKTFKYLFKELEG
jgi:dihydropteroate synthase